MTEIQQDKELKGRTKKTYKINYHLAPGVVVSVGGVSSAEAKKLKTAWNDPMGVIIVGGRDTKKTQYIPKSSVLVAEVVEELSS